jgi:hypothetical protein
MQSESSYTKHFAAVDNRMSDDSFLMAETALKCNFSSVYNFELFFQRSEVLSTTAGTSVACLTVLVIFWVVIH